MSAGDDQCQKPGAESRNPGHVTDTEQVVGTVPGLLFMSLTAEGKKLSNDKGSWSDLTGVSCLRGGQNLCAQNEKGQL